MIATLLAAQQANDDSYKGGLVNPLRALWIAAGALVQNLERHLAFEPRVHARYTAPPPPSNGARILYGPKAVCGTGASNFMERIDARPSWFEGARVQFT
jgi:hypothetical protein